jgi:precorrin-6B methylase 2
VKSLLKKALYGVAPETTTALLSARSRAYSHRLVREWGLGELTRKLIDRFGPTVQSGPFRGLTLTPMTLAEHLGPFLLGTYEVELHPWLEEVGRGTYSQLLDVGAKFGYYAVGLARYHPTSRVVAFDTDWWARKATREMAVANQTSNVETAGFCSPAWLNSYLQPNSFILSDCEGYEATLFGDCHAKALDSATLLIEVHDDVVAGAGAQVRERFAASHDVRLVTNSGERSSPVNLEFVTFEERRSALYEVRGAQEWLFFNPRGDQRTSLT